MADKPSQEKTEKATPRKLKKAREKGQVARSMELNSVIIVSFAFMTLFLMGPIIFNQMGDLIRHTFTEAPNMTLVPDSFHKIFSNKVMNFAAIVGPVLLIVAIIAFGINVAQVGFMMSFKTIEPKFDKLNIIKGFGRLLSKRSMVQLVRDVVKTILIAIVAYTTISGWMPDILVVGTKATGQLGINLGKLALVLALKLSAVLFILALFDFAFQRWDFANQQKMTKQEVREEMKDTDGNPVLKGRIKQVQRDMARRRMISEVPEADVVVTNPTLIAVALKYDSDVMAAPMVVAKGQRLIARKIKQIAKKYDIPIVENKPLARSLFKMVDIGSYVPAELYRAIAEVLAYIYKLKGKGGVARA
ncbi:MAG: flagellar biosynthesis protein FlhB [candidate division Zixibacteria bacterium]